MAPNIITVNVVEHRSLKCLQAVLALKAGTTYKQAAQAALDQLDYDILSIQNENYQEINRSEWNRRVCLVTYHAWCNGLIACRLLNLERIVAGHRRSYQGVC